VDKNIHCWSTYLGLPASSFFILESLPNGKFLNEELQHVEHIKSICKKSFCKKSICKPIFYNKFVAKHSCVQELY